MKPNRFVVNVENIWKLNPKHKLEEDEVIVVDLSELRELLEKDIRFWEKEHKKPCNKSLIIKAEIVGRMESFKELLAEISDSRQGTLLPKSVHGKRASGLPFGYMAVNKKEERERK